MYYAIVETWLDGVFKFSTIITKLSNSTFVKTYGAISFNIFQPLLGLAINNKCGLMPLHCKSHRTFTFSFSFVMVLKMFFAKLCSQCIAFNVFQMKRLTHIIRLKIAMSNFNNKIRPCLEIAMIQNYKDHIIHKHLYQPTNMVNHIIDSCALHHVLQKGPQGHYL